MQTADFYTYNMFLRYILFLKKWIRIHFFTLFLLDTRNNPTDMTRNIYKFCQQDYGFYFAENTPLINHAHLTYSIQQ